MAKFWKVLKVIIFIWGALTLALILGTILYVNISERMTARSVSQEPTDEVYEKTFEDIRLTVTHKRGDESGKVLVNLSKAGVSLARNYALPIKKYNLEWFQASDADIIRVTDNEYRIVLYGSGDEDEEFSYDSVWFLKYKNELKVVEVVNLSQMRRINDLDMVILGHKNVGLPSQEDFEHVGFRIPIEVRVGNSIQITPLLSQNGIRLIKKVFNEEAQKRMDAVRAQKDKAKDKDKEEDGRETLKQVNRALNNLNEAIEEKTVSY